MSEVAASVVTVEMAVAVTAAALVAADWVVGTAAVDLAAAPAAAGSAAALAVVVLVVGTAAVDLAAAVTAAMVGAVSAAALAVVVLVVGTAGVDLAAAVTALAAAVTGVTVVDAAATVEAAERQSGTCLLPSLRSERHRTRLAVSIQLHHPRCCRIERRTQTCLCKPSRFQLQKSTWRIRTASQSPSYFAQVHFH